MKFGADVPCNECPWRRDVAVGRFAPERFVALADTCKQQYGQTMFACHKSGEGEEFACAGFLIVEGLASNLSVRLAMLRRRFDPGRLSSPWPLYGSYREMAVANGVSPHHPALKGLRP